MGAEYQERIASLIAERDHLADEVAALDDLVAQQQSRLDMSKSSLTFMTVEQAMRELRDMVNLLNEKLDELKHNRPV